MEEIKVIDKQEQDKDKEKVTDKQGQDKESEKEEPKEKNNKNIPWRSITCPNCKFKGFGKDFLYNKQFNYTVCKECGVMFMNPMMVKALLKSIDSPIQVVKDV